MINALIDRMRAKQQHIDTGKRAPRCLAGMLLLLGMLLSACEKDDYEPKTAINCTMLFYMGGDNNLSNEVNAKIEQIKTAQLPKDCRVVIYTDVRGENPQLLELTLDNGRLTVETVHTYPESNSASAETFGAVLREITERYQCPSYGLVLFSHASGWLPEGTYNNTVSRSVPALRSVIIDGASEMELPAFAASIPDGMFDFVVFEACYMAGVEVAYELKDKARHIVASAAEIVSPGFAACYKEALPYLYAGDLLGFCRTVEADYRTRSGDYGSLTLSLIDTKGLDALADVVRGMELQGGNGNIQAFDRNGGTLFFDLGESYKSVGNGQHAALQSAIDGCVVWKAATATFMPTYGGFEVKAHSGLTTYIPQENYTRLNEAYKDLKWYKAISNKE